MAATLTLGVCAAAPAVAAAAAAPTLSGVYAGPADASADLAFGAWRNSPVTIVGDFTGNNSWSGLTDPSWLINGLAPVVQQGVQLELDVPLLVPNQPGTLEAGAQGAYDQYFLSLAQQLVAAGDGSAILRLGGEFNGSWEAYAVQPTGPDSAPYFIAYWQHLVDLFRSVPGANFKFDWCSNIGQGTSAPDAAYPGNAYVDYIGVDVYDASWSGDGGPAGRWQAIENEPYGLNWWNTFAAAHGKPMSIPEWGVVTTGSNAGGDDPYFIQQMYNWISANHPAFEIYFDYGASSLSLSSATQSAAAYLQLFGGAASTTTAGTTAGSTSTTAGSTSTTAGSTSTTAGSTSTTAGSTSTTVSGTVHTVAVRRGPRHAKGTRSAQVDVRSRSAARRREMRREEQRRRGIRHHKQRRRGMRHHVQRRRTIRRHVERRRTPRRPRHTIRAR
ncbi:glycoside hydrolase family 26 protein [Conexibacter sp. DBS9H8]|uniref:glycoside hydrolase family 26 protein n=1 Tax=Conexibacter sp. DBS9H8 TaxID=2937801 RepID=UPI0020106DFE|nr:hypothetical protein [Conexibacter sp. DBS9H8]